MNYGCGSLLVKILIGVFGRRICWVASFAEKQFSSGKHPTPKPVVLGFHHCLSFLGPPRLFMGLHTRTRTRTHKLCEPAQTKNINIIMSLRRGFIRRFVAYLGILNPRKQSTANCPSTATLHQNGDYKINTMAVCGPSVDWTNRHPWRRYILLNRAGWMDVLARIISLCVCWICDWTCRSGARCWHNISLDHKL